MHRAKIAIAFILAVIVAVVGVSIIHSLFVQGNLAGLGVAMPLGLRLETILKDFSGLALPLGAVIAAALGFGFLIASFLKRRLIALAWIAYPLAGATAVGAALLLMKAAMDITPIAGARTTPGLLLMAAAGALGGLIFARLRPKSG